MTRGARSARGRIGLGGHRPSAVLRKAGNAMAFEHSKDLRSFWEFDQEFLVALEMM